MFELSEILRIRIGQKEIIHDNKVLVPGNLPRCSYKFCSYKDTCSYNYNNNIKRQCYQDHYVHRMVSADLAILIQYIEQTFKDHNSVIHNKEILKTIGNYDITNKDFIFRDKLFKIIIPSEFTLHIGNCLCVFYNIIEKYIYDSNIFN